MLKVGLTGGIGSGKSIVAAIFEVLRIPVYYSDREAKRIMNENETVKKKLIEYFGEDTYSNGQLSRSYLASVIFNDSHKTELVNSLIHPEVIADADKWFAQQSAPYAIKEAALIFESGAHQHLDKVIGVSAPQNLRLQRITQRDNMKPEEIFKRMEKQMDEEIKMRLCDYIIQNDESQMLLPQVLELDRVLRGESCKL